jgi:nicotinate-nucleotide adenylyltransferase
MRLGVFGGSFDPVHNGHLALARACQQQAELDEVWFTPTAIQPLKKQGPHASDSQRIEMLRLATVEENTWRVCTLEIDRGGQSYTVDTLRQLHDELATAELYFLVGSDALTDVAQWKQPREIFRLATPLVVHRAGRPQPDLAPLQSICASDSQPRLIEMPAMYVSSTDIRHRVAMGEPVDMLLPAAVAAYIAQQGLYRPVSRED